MDREEPRKGKWKDEEKTLIESLFAIKRAGADAILTYAALEIAQQLK